MSNLPQNLGGQFGLELGGQFAPKSMVNLDWKVVVNLTVFSILSRNASANPDTQNLNTLPELLLLGGGVPIIVNNKVIGSVGIAGAGGPEQDDAIAQKIETLFQ